MDSHLQEDLAKRNAELETLLAAKERELEIEAALERVRSASMAMHSSNDLHHVIRVLTDQLSVLGFHFHTANFITNDSMPDWEIWISSPGVTGVPPRIHVPYMNHILFNQRHDAIAAGEEFLSASLNKEEKDAFFHYLFENTVARVTPEERKEWVYQQKGMGLTTVLMKNISLSVINYDGMLYTARENEVIKRFTNVFEQSYTRFLDLQKAEAQAREAQIQLSLERVRARAMAMHRSDELSEVLTVLFEQYDVLEVDPVYVDLSIIDPSSNTFTWRCTGKAGQRVFAEQVVDLNSMDVWKDAVEKWVAGETHEVVTLFFPKEVLPRVFELFSEIRAKIPKDAIFTDKDFPDGLYTTQGFCKFGALGFGHYRKPTEEEKTIVAKFAIEFERLYQRFLDLQKAEAQAREAQIEAALERVRSRTTGMQKSEELREVIQLVFEQLRQLDFNIDSAHFNLNYKESDDYNLWSAAPGQPYPVETHIPYFDHPVFIKAREAKEKGLDFFTESYTQAEKNKFFEHLFKYIPAISPERRQYILSGQGVAASTVLMNTISLWVMNYAGIPYSEAENAILKRFGKVFEQSHTRFLDLQKSEEQARESQIQLALERVRARTMAMQHSEELSDTSFVLFQQLKDLGETGEQISIGIFNEEERVLELFATIRGNQWQRPAKPGLDRQPVMKAIYSAWKEQKKSLVVDLTGDALRDYNKFRMEANLGLYNSETEFDQDRWVINVAFFSKGMLSFSSHDPRPPETIRLLERFAGVFDLTYTRFLDLKQAEARAREAQIEAALERIRSHSMAMHQSGDLHDVIKVVTEQLLGLGIKFNVANFARIFSEGSWDLWISTPEQAYPALVHVPYINHRLFNNVLEAIAEGRDFVTDVYDQEEKNIFFKHFFENTLAKNTPKERKEFVMNCKGFARSLFLTKNIWLAVSNYDGIPFSNEENAIFKRFANAFEQSYTRFLDLQKAEANAREAQIEAALEKVRSRSLAMHKSDEMQDVVHTLFERLKDLNVDFYTVIIIIFQRGSKDIVWWLENKEQQQYPRILLRYSDNPYLKDLFEAKENGKELLSKSYPFAEKNELYHYLFSATELKYVPEKQKKFLLESEFATMSVALAKKTAIHITSYSKRSFSEEENEILKRFAKVFDQAYTRFLDLQKAEAQAREAHIEAALERVRSKVMAMRNSEDLNETIKVFYYQLESLNLTPRRCGVGLLNKENHTAELFTMNTSTEGQSVELIGKLDMTMHPVLEGVYNGWLKQEEYHPVLRGYEINEYYKLLRPQIQFPDYPHDAVQYGYFFFFDEGGVYAWTEKQMEEAELQIYRRFTAVLNLTYKRYKDLKQAEANAKEAVKQAALDRIRADIASMRSVSDLDRITPLIWNELTILGIPFIRCGVFIMDDVQQLIHTFLSAPDGRAIAAFHLPYDTPGNLGKVLSHWKKNKSYIDHWGEDEFMNLTDILVKQGSIANREEYLASLPHGGLYLHFLPFLQGMLYVGNTTLLGEEEIKLLQSVADAFSTAYARYEDFNKLEAAKKQVDSTLNELQATQRQLIQSEKMASLGELTAGIAHEIQNPLNFVNNFSEVSNELVDEMTTEFLNGNANEALGIAADLKDNLEKISHHGKRADAIVKGMLQHSKTSTGQKEPTDINMLCDEYLRLSYHGLRAKDKSFNATMKTDFDESIGKINMVPQDIGRVLLNLFNNAFYAVKSHNPPKAGEHYEPLVSVSTRKIAPLQGMGAKVEIIVTDNGSGIPQNIVDKIFQPFFTTKPAGQGTGLGLSLAYDIVKAHGGEIKVETKAGEGTTFVIQLPV